MRQTNTSTWLARGKSKIKVDVHDSCVVFCVAPFWIVNLTLPSFSVFVFLAEPFLVPASSAYGCWTLLVLLSSVGKTRIEHQKIGQLEWAWFDDLVAIQPMVMINIMISNSNWTNWSTIQGVNQQLSFSLDQLPTKSA